MLREGRDSRVQLQLKLEFSKFFKKKMTTTLSTSLLNKMDNNSVTENY